MPSSVALNLIKMKSITCHLGFLGVGFQLGLGSEAGIQIQGLSCGISLQYCLVVIHGAHGFCRIDSKSLSSLIQHTESFKKIL